MYSHYKNSYVPYIFLFLLSALFFACIGCDSVLPTDFKDKNFTGADIDLRAGKLLTQDTLNDVAGYTYSYRALDSTMSVITSRTLVSLATATDTTDNQIIYSKFDTLANTLLPVLHPDSLIRVKYPKNQNVIYAALNMSSGQAKDIYIYTSLLYYSGNINDKISVDIIKRDTSLVSSSVGMPTESVFCSYQKIMESSAPRIVATIRARYKVHLEQGSVYLVRFTLSSVTISNPLRTNQFKVAILSF